MLREIYTAVGGVGAFFVAVAMFLSFVAWLMAVTGTVVRDIPRTVKVFLVLLISLIPPLSIFLASAFLVQDRMQAKSSRKKITGSDIGSTGFPSSRLIPVPVRDAA